MELDRIPGLYQATLNEVGKVIVGQHELVEGVTVALFAEGSVLIEGVPGLAKTLLVNTLAQTVSCHFRRTKTSAIKLLSTSSICGTSMR